MSDIISPLLQWLNDHPDLAGLATFIISAAESVAIIGTIVPGSIMMTALGALAGAGIIPLWATISWAILGAIVGDGISYWIGHHFKSRLPHVWPFRHYPTLLTSGKLFFLKYGAMSVFIGRFVGPVRALVPLVAGMLGMRPLRFLVANITSAIGWAPAYMLPGILLGAASLELPPDIAVHVMLVLLLIGLFILLCIWFIYKFFQLVRVQTNQIQNNIWHQLKRSRQLSFITILLKHHNANKSHGQLNLAFYVVLISLLFIALVAYIKINGASTLIVNDAMFHFFRGIRTSNADSIMIDITLLGQKQVLLPVVVVIFAWLVFWKRWRAAMHALALGILSAGSVFVLKNLLKSPRPWGIFQSMETYSMPSGHTAMATTVYIGMAFLFACSIRPKHRWQIYSLGVLVTLAVGISRLYLGAHWFTDVLSSWLLGAAILLLVIISYQRYKEKPVKLLGISLISLITLTTTLTFYHYRHFEQLKIAYTQVNWPTLDITMNEWWQKNNALPAYHSSLFGFPSQLINIEWVGSLEKIEASLIKEGWSTPPARDWVSTLHRVADIKSAQYLPMVSPQYLDKKPALILIRHSDSEKNTLVLRLWNSNRNIKDSQTAIWVGVVGVIPRSYSWVFKNNPGEININPVLVFPNKTGAWQWKTMRLYQPTGTKVMINQQILLIRANNSVHKKK